ncbi:MAG: transglutaminase family protein [Zoogloea sp.]|nr:transglutaminase family protein [Zoogloea sp.]
MSDVPSSLLRSTPLLDTQHPDIERLVAERGWRVLPMRERIGAVYDFVRDAIAFGYNEADDLPASRVLADRYGQCNTKGTLLMTLLRSSGVPCRLHGFTIDKALQKGAITGLAYVLAPRRIIHSWVEVWFEGQWVCLEGFILDAQYLSSLQRQFPTAKRFCGYGAATPDLSEPQVEWRGEDTFIQRDGIVDDFGVFDDPDAFYARHGSNLKGLKRWLFAYVVRRYINRNVNRIRSGRW